MAKRRLGIIASAGWMDPNAQVLRQQYPGQLEVAQSRRCTRTAAPDADAMVIVGSGLRSGRWRTGPERVN